MNSDSILISIVSPIYKGEKMLDELISRIETSVETITNNYEIILVNDCSPDNSWEKMKEICKVNPKVKGINLSRNFGQHYAITAGLADTTGEWIVVMDCDLQDRPEEIPNLYKKALEGYDIVLAEIIKRDDKFLKKFTSVLFLHVFAFLTDSNVKKRLNNFGIYKHNVISAVLDMGDAIRNFPRQVNWVGFRKGYIQVHKDARAEGTSGYSWRKLCMYALDNIISFSNKPLRMMVQFGGIMVILSFLLAIFYFFRYFFIDVSISGFTTLVISIWFVGGMIISMIGMVGIYIGKIFDQNKNRPLYIIKEKINFK